MLVLATQWQSTKDLEEDIAFIFRVEECAK
jgi:hypothetical protein